MTALRFSGGGIAAALAVGALVLGGAGKATAQINVFGLTTTNDLVNFDSASPGVINSTVAITGLQAGESLLGIDFRPVNGQLFGLGSTSRLYLIDQVSGVASQVGPAGAFTLSGTAFGFDFNPTVDRIRVVSDADQSLRLNPNDGALAGTDTPLAYAAGDPNVGANPNIVGAAYDRNDTNPATPTTLYAIDSNLDTLVEIGGEDGSPSPNGGLLFTTGALGFNTSDLVGFDISGNDPSTRTGLASLTAPGGATSSLFAVNLDTGAATSLGTIGGGNTIRGIAVVTVAAPEPATIALLATGLLPVVGAIIRKRRRSSKA